MLLYTPGARDGPFVGLFRDHLRYFDVDSAECFATASEKPAVGRIVETLFEIGPTLGVEVSSSALPHVISIVETTVRRRRRRRGSPPPPPRLFFAAA